MAQRIKHQQHIVLLGAGYVARCACDAFQARGFDITATGRVREDSFFEQSGIGYIHYEGGSLPSPLTDALRDASHLLVSIPPRGGNDPAVAEFSAQRFPNIEWTGYLSATSVYGDRGGHWAFEDELLFPVNARGRHRIEAELAWLEAGINTHIFRLAGIYGPSRSPFEKLRAETAQAVIKPDHVVNRIHVDDIVAALIASMESPDPGQVYNVADGHPAPPQEVLDYAAEIIGAPYPPHIPLEHAELSEMARSFYAETKCVDNSRLINLGWHPIYPNYKAGLRALLRKD